MKSRLSTSTSSSAALRRRRTWCAHALAPRAPLAMDATHLPALPALPSTLAAHDATPRHGTARNRGHRAQRAHVLTVAARAQVKYDSVHGIWGHEVEAVSGSEITVGSRSLSFSEFKAFTDVPWKEKGVELVIDCTGVFLTTEVLKDYLTVCGVKRVVVSAPVKEPSVLNVVVGVNDHKLTEAHTICTAASCTTNCIAPIIKARAVRAPSARKSSEV